MWSKNHFRNIALIGFILMIVGTGIVYLLTPYTDTVTSDVNSQLDEIESTTQQIPKGEWNEIATYSGVGEYRSDYFFIPEHSEVELRISWINYASDSDKGIRYIMLYERGDDTHFDYYKVPEVQEGTYLIHAPIPTGQAYLELDTWVWQDSGWKVIVEAWMPE